MLTPIQKKGSLPRFLASHSLDVVTLGVNAVAWQTAYEQWFKRVSWGYVLPFLGGCVLTGVADASVSVLSYLASQLFLSSSAEPFSQRVSSASVAKMLLAYSLIAALWQPLVNAGEALGSLDKKDSQTVTEYAIAGLTVFFGNVVMALLSAKVLPIGLRPDPLVLALSETCFYITGPLDLPGSAAGTNNRDILYAGAFTFAGALLSKCVQGALHWCQSSPSQPEAVYSGRTDSGSEAGYSMLDGGSAL